MLSSAVSSMDPATVRAVSGFLRKVAPARKVKSRLKCAFDVGVVVFEATHVQAQSVNTIGEARKLARTVNQPPLFYDVWFSVFWQARSRGVRHVCSGWILYMD